MSWVSSNVGGVRRCGKGGISRPFGTIHLSLNTTQDCVLGYFQVWTGDMVDRLDRGHG